MTLNLQKSDLVYWISGLAVLVFVAWRAWYMAPYQDEISTFFFYVQPGAINPYSAHLDANNHVVNSLLSFWSYRVFDSPEFFFVRLPNVLAFCLLLFYLHRLGSLFESSIKSLWFRLAVICCIYTISFFSLSRGYGLSYAFLAGAMFHLLAMGNRHQTLHLLAGLANISLAAWSNLSQLLLLLVLAGLFLIRSLSDRKRTLPHILFWTVLAGIPLSLAIDYSLLLDEKGLLYLGESSGLFSRCVAPLLNQILPGSVFRFTFFALLLLSTAHIGYQGFHTRKLTHSGLLSLLFWSGLFGMVLSHWLMGTNYPVGRALFHLYLVALFQIFFWIDTISLRLFPIVGAVFVLPFVIQLLTGLNDDFVPMWRETTMSREFVAVIDEGKPEDRLPLVMTSPIMDFSYNHFNFIDQKNYNVAQGAQHSEAADFLILNEWSAPPNPDRYQQLLVSPTTNTALYKRREELQWILHETQSFDSTIVFAEKFHALKPVRTGGHQDTSFRVDVACDIDMQTSDAEIFLVLELRSSSEERLVYLPYELRRIQALSAMHEFEKSFFIEEHSGNGTNIHVYFWSPSGDSAVIRKLRVDFYKSESIKESTRDSAELFESSTRRSRQQRLSNSSVTLSSATG
ncbi:MAG: hypothetical protein DRJ65_18055 [Acidobacteria bacterium]|nr:MAG: hypothetical protein DRJ65_18055 [Acidobacteriota bacterium]